VPRKEVSDVGFLTDIRLSEWEETTLRVMFEGEEPSVQPGTRRSIRSKSKSVNVTIKKTMTIKDLKVEILHVTRISPISQELYYRDRPLELNETMESLGVLAKDEIRCVELEEKEMDEVGVGVEGFGGTVLVGRISCPDCTYVNAPGVVACDMCARPFGFD
jgi:hypothetical protein